MRRLLAHDVTLAGPRHPRRDLPRIFALVPDGLGLGQAAPPRRQVRHSPDPRGPAAPRRHLQRRRRPRHRPRRPVSDPGRLGGGQRTLQPRRGHVEGHPRERQDGLRLPARERQARRPRTRLRRLRPQHPSHEPDARPRHARPRRRVLHRHLVGDGRPQHRRRPGRPRPDVDPRRLQPHRQPRRPASRRHGRRRRLHRVGEELDAQLVQELARDAAEVGGVGNGRHMPPAVASSSTPESRGPSDAGPEHSSPSRPTPNPEGPCPRGHEPSMLGSPGSGRVWCPLP